MIILKTILLVLLIIIAVLLAIVVLLLIIPFKYELNLAYKNEERLELKLKYIIFKITGFFAYSPEVDFEVKLWNKVLLKKENDDEEEEDEEDNSIADTDFIENKDLENDVKESKSAIRDLFTSAKNLEAKKKEELELEEEDDDEIEEIAEEKEEKKKKAFNFIDKFKNFLDNDIVYVLKKVASEIINVLSVFKPKRYNVTVKYSREDPYTMGMALAISAPLYAFMGENLKVMQNSDSKFNEGNIRIIGYPRLYKLIPPIFKLYRDKRLRGTIFKKKK